MKSILLKTDEVKAVLDGRKSQKRIVIKIPSGTFWLGSEIYDNKLDFGIMGTSAVYSKKIPYEIGDVLWVKETWNCIPLHAGLYDMPDKKSNEIVGYDYWYRADDTDQNPDDKWRPSIHMPREAARIFLEVTDRWVERLQDIKDIDIKAEGIVLYDKDAEFDNECSDETRRLMEFQILWDSTIKDQDIYRYGYDANPWVINYEFKRTDCI